MFLFQINFRTRGTSIEITEIKVTRGGTCSNGISSDEQQIQPDLFENDAADEFYGTQDIQGKYGTITVHSIRQMDT